MKVKQIIRNKKGEASFIAIAVSLVVFIAILIIIINVFGLMKTYTDLHFVAENTVMVAGINGKIDAKVDSAFELCKSKVGLAPSMVITAKYFNNSNKTVQFGDPIDITISSTYSLVGLTFIDIPIEFTVKRTALSEKYWK